MSKKDEFQRVAVHSRIDVESYRELERIAQLNFVTKSSVIRWAIMLYLQGGEDNDKKKA